MTSNPLTDGETVLASFFNAASNGHVKEGIISGVSPSTGTGNWDVDFTSGTARFQVDEVSVTGGTVTLTAPSSDADLDAGEARVDLITVDSGGTVTATEGTAATGNKQPIAPDIPTDEALIAAVFVDGDASALTSADIRDYRIFLQRPINTETGTESTTNNDPQTFSVSLNEAYDPDEWILTANWEALSASNRVDASFNVDNYTTDGNGNFTGFDIVVESGFTGETVTVRWRVFGRPV